MLYTIKKEWQAKVTVLYFLAVTVWWFIGPSFKTSSDARFLGDPGSVYFLIAIIGTIWGFVISAQWGGLKSILGKAIFFFALGLAGQVFGQFSYGYYPFALHEAAPYPSLGDIGYFGSIPFYTLGIYFLALTSGVKISARSFAQKLQTIIVPLFVLAIGYILFLQGYTIDWTNPIKTFLDFGYPLGQAFYVSLALLTYSLSKGTLGGIMKTKILFILFALFVQFLADYIFLYQSNKGFYAVGGLADYMYFTAYTLMTLGLIQFKTVYDRLQSK